MLSLMIIKDLFEIHMNGSLVLKECHIIISRSAHVGLGVGKTSWRRSRPLLYEGEVSFSCCSLFLINFRKKEN